MSSLIEKLIRKHNMTRDDGLFSGTTSDGRTILATLFADKNFRLWIEFTDGNYYRFEISKDKIIDIGRIIEECLVDRETFYTKVVAPWIKEKAIKSAICELIND